MKTSPTHAYFLWLMLLTTGVSNFSEPVHAEEFMKNVSREETGMSLEEQLQELSEQSKSSIPTPECDIMRKAIEDLQSSGLLNQVLRVGDKAPDFSLTDATGKRVSLKHLLAKGPVVLTFYRGGWCPYCNLALRALQKVLPNIEAQNSTLVAVSPQMPDSSLTTAEKDKLTFEVLSDIGNSTARKYGIVYRLSPQLLPIYNSLGIDLFKSNGDDSHELPLSATFIIDKNQTIRYQFADPDYKKRMEPADIVLLLKTLNTRQP